MISSSIVLVDGSWTGFSTYSTCSSICSPGLQASYRTCVNETAGGMVCTGYGLQFQNCSGYNDSYQLQWFVFKTKSHFILIKHKIYYRIATGVLGVIGVIGVRVLFRVALVINIKHDNVLVPALVVLVMQSIQQLVIQL